MNHVPAGRNASHAPRIVVLDLGGVVVRICRSWQEGCAAAGVPHRAQTEHLLRTPRVLGLIDLHQRGALPCDQFHLQLADALQGMYAADELAAIHAAWTQEEYRGVADAIDRIHAAGLETGCLSNTNASHWSVLERGQAFQKIRRRLASHLVGLAKPDPAIYRAFERASGYAGGQILFLDDLDENVAAARECGWRAAQIDHTGDTAAQILGALERHGVRA